MNWQIFVIALLIPLCHAHIRIGREKTRSVVEFDYSGNKISKLMKEIADFYGNAVKRCWERKLLEFGKLLFHTWIIKQ